MDAAVGDEHDRRDAVGDDARQYTRPLGVGLVLLAVERGLGHDHDLTVLVDPQIDLQLVAALLVGGRRGSGEKRPRVSLLGANVNLDRGSRHRRAAGNVDDVAGQWH